MSDKPYLEIKSAKSEEVTEGGIIPTAIAAQSIESGLAQRLLSQRRQREGLLGRELASEPAWTMLLNLFVAYEQGRPLEVMKLCAESGAPRATALRWFSTLAAEDHIVWRSRTKDPYRGRVNLAPQTADRLRELFRSWMRERT